MTEKWESDWKIRNQNRCIDSYETCVKIQIAEILATQKNCYEITKFVCSNRFQKINNTKPKHKTLKIEKKTILFSIN